MILDLDNVLFAAGAGLFILVLVVFGKKLPPPTGPTAASLLVALLLGSTATARAEEPADGIFGRAQFVSTISTLSKLGEDRAPVVGMRATIDVPTAAGVRLILRADLSRMGDGGAVDAGSVIIPDFQTGELYFALYRRVVSVIAFEVVYGRAFALDPDQTLIEADPEIWGAGLRLELRGGFIFVGMGRHGAAGSGTRLLVSLILPAKGNTSLMVDGAIGEQGKSVVRSGVAVKF